MHFRLIHDVMQNHFFSFCIAHSKISEEKRSLLLPQQLLERRQVVFACLVRLRE